MNQTIVRCCGNSPEYEMTYSVAGTVKKYLICSSCVNLEIFKKFLISKQKITEHIQ
jgi:hypothetical protein